MLRALFWTLALSAAVAAALLVPISGRSVWNRAEDRGIPQAVGREADRLIAWLKGTEAPPAPAKKPAAKADPRAAQTRAPRKVPQERITSQDRAALDDLIQRSR